MDIFKTLLNIGNLLVTTGGQQSVVLTMEPAEHIALGLAMAYQINFSHGYLT